MTDTTAATTAANETIPAEAFRGALLTMLDEAFFGANGSSYFTDQGTSLFETLATIDAETASRRFSDRASNIAAQVNHIRFYLDTLMDGVKNGWKPADWPGSWAVEEVSPEEWQALIDRLQETVTQIREFAASNTLWTTETIGGGIAIVAHTAYHLGEIRSSLAALHVPEPVVAETGAEASA